MSILEAISEDAVALWAINVLVQATVISTLALIATRLLRNSAVLRWWLLGAAMALILLSPASAWLVPSTGLSMMSISTGENASTVQLRTDPIPVEASPPMSETSLPPKVFETERITERHPTVGEPSVATSAPQLTSITESVNRTPVMTLNSAVLAFCCVWMGGFAFFLVRMLHGCFRLYGILRTAKPINDVKALTALANACRQLNLEKKPLLVQTEAVASPVATGLRQPVILMPEAIAENLNQEQFSDVLLHETAHIARSDQWIVIGQNITCSLFWLNPLVHLVNRHFAQAREEVCDNFVLRSTSGASYSRTLLKLGEHLSHNSQALSAAVGMLDDWSLESRVSGLLKSTRDTKTPPNERLSNKPP